MAYYALTQKVPSWELNRAEMVTWLIAQLGVEPTTESDDEEHHRFDAAMSVLAALRGLNRVSPVDLHTSATSSR